MPDNKYSDADVNVRALLMKLYHSRQIGEAFYHAAFVNGEAPQLEADGLIERHGDGWRLTQAGLQAWAEMNAHLFESNQRYRGAVFAEMRKALLREGRSSMTGICNKEGCGQPRHVSLGGHEFTFCMSLATFVLMANFNPSELARQLQSSIKVKQQSEGE